MTTLIDKLKSPWPADFALQPKTAQERLDVIAIQQLKKEAAKEIERLCNQKLINPVKNQQYDAGLKMLDED